ncbi:MAG: hypothetical protein HGB11_07025 [Chlorobiales bacterium]|nr:hypothetical protein [Chlorobiales bacterium]
MGTIVGFVGIFVLAIVVAIWATKKRAKAVQEFAATQGWSYSRKDTERLDIKIEDVFIEEGFTLSNIMTLESGAQRALFLCDCAFYNRARPRHQSNAAVCLIISNRFQSVSSNVEIHVRTGIGEQLLKDQIDMGGTEFARSFIVLSKDAAFAKKLISPAMQEVLLVHVKASPDFSVRIGFGSGCAVLLSSYDDKFERCNIIADLARKIESVMK